MRTIHDLSENFSDGLLFPKGTSAERGNPEAGYFRYNTETKGIEVYDGTSWSSMDNTPSYVTDGLVLNLDAGNLNSYDGSGTTWSDLAQNGNDGTISGATYDSNGHFVFNGSSNYIHSFSNSISTWGTSDFSYCFWVSWSSTGGVYNIVFSNYTSANSGFLLGLQNGVFESHFSSYDNVLTTWTPTINTWYQMTVVREGNLNKIFRNSDLLDSGPTSANINMTTAPEIGHIPSASQAGWFSGSLAIFKVYDKALSSDEITHNFNASKTRFGL